MHFSCFQMNISLRRCWPHIWRAYSRKLYLCTAGDIIINYLCDGRRWKQLRMIYLHGVSTLLNTNVCFYMIVPLTVAIKKRNNAWGSFNIWADTEECCSSFMGCVQKDLQIVDKKSYCRGTNSKKSEMYLISLQTEQREQQNIFIVLNIRSKGSFSLAGNSIEENYIIFLK